jgi:tyrosyl-tRNA synthetase
LTHGEEAAERAEETARTLFGRGGVSSESVSADIPTVEISAGEFGDRFTIAEAFVRAGLCSSRGEARRLATQGGLTIDDERIDDVDRPFSLQGEAVLLRVGKKRYMRLVVR